jgi:hypothetical protein
MTKVTSHRAVLKAMYSASVVDSAMMVVCILKALQPENDNVAGSGVAGRDITSRNPI